MAKPALNRDVVERVARLYDLGYDAEVFCDEFRQPFLSRGYLTLDELATIVAWKSRRQKTNVLKNAAEVVAAVTRQAFAIGEPRLAAWMLRYLEAVSTRMASAILTVYDPDRYTVLDVRAWAALEQLGLLEPLGLDRFGGSATVSLNSCETYGAYVDACAQLAAATGVSLRTLDRCLWTVDRLKAGGLAEHGTSGADWLAR